MDNKTKNTTTKEESTTSSPKKVTVTAVSLAGSNASLNFTLGKKNYIVLPGEVLEVNENELVTLNALSNSWKFEKEGKK